jgi:repressor LexA
MARPNNDFRHLDVLREHYAREKVLPSYAKLGQILGFRGKAGAYQVVKRLISAGYLERTQSGRLAPAERFFELPKLDDTVHAGLSESSLWSGGVEPHSLDRLLIERPSLTILVPIRGDSMIEAGVLDGDTAVVERTENAGSGDFVVALVDGQYTLKELRYEERRPVLVPHNKEYETIRPQQELQILGIVKGIVRRYRQRHKSARRQGETT